MPIGACLANEKAGNVFQPGNHGSTFGGNPLMCATASTVIDTIKSENLLSNVNNMSRYLLGAFNDKLGQLDGVREIRGLGLMIGIELDSKQVEHECSEFVKLALQKNLLINVTAGSVIRLLPPLILDQQQADSIVATVCELVIDSLQNKAAA